MSMTQTETLIGESAAYGGCADRKDNAGVFGQHRALWTVGGIVTIVLAVVGLAHTAPEMMAAIATVVFGAALLIQGGNRLYYWAIRRGQPFRLHRRAYSTAGAGSEGAFLPLMLTGQR